MIPLLFLLVFVEVTPEGGIEVNLVDHKPTVQSSLLLLFGKNFPAHLAVDGNPKTCSHTMQQLLPWWKVDLGRICNFTTIKVRTTYQGIKGTHLTKCEVFTGNSKNGLKRCVQQRWFKRFGLLKINLTGRCTGGRYLKLQLLGIHSLVLCHVEIYENRVKRPRASRSKQSITATSRDQITGTTSEQVTTLPQKHQIEVKLKATTVSWRGMGSRLEAETLSQPIQVLSSSSLGPPDTLSSSRHDSTATNAVQVHMKTNNVASRFHDHFSNQLAHDNETSYVNGDTDLSESGSNFSESDSKPRGLGNNYSRSSGMLKGSKGNSLESVSNFSKSESNSTELPGMPHSRTTNNKDKQQTTYDYEKKGGYRGSHKRPYARKDNASDLKRKSNQFGVTSVSGTKPIYADLEAEREKHLKESEQSILCTSSAICQMGSSFFSVVGQDGDDKQTSSAGTVAESVPTSLPDTSTDARDPHNQLQNSVQHPPSEMPTTRTAPESTDPRQFTVRDLHRKGDSFKVKNQRYSGKDRYRNISHANNGEAPSMRLHRSRAGIRGMFSMTSSTTRCICICRNALKTFDKVKTIQGFLKINKSSLARVLGRKRSARNKEQSAKYIGGTVGVLLIMLFVIGILLPDCISLARYLLK